ncbi:uncharacterized protein LOC126819790 [Patella vulgata]|uniref:uncharacterized protein LOC126819790 n=1 Tax=Patella vulgata TaxID=6465 RepID=UPI0024A9C24F|nr:uncharacterized protein LOC126819790 [Patella vulgata]
MNSQMLSCLTVFLVVFVVNTECQYLKFKPYKSLLTAPDPDDKVWTFAVSGRIKIYSYLDKQGKLSGWTVDFVNEVCRLARKKCSMVLAEFTECTYTDRNINYPGRGLNAGWFDACTGYTVTEDRLSTYDMSLAYLKAVSTFAVLPGNPSGFDPSLDDYSNFTITHLTGACSNAACMTRFGKKYGNIKIAANLPDAKQILANKEADALFYPRDNVTDLDNLSPKFHCEIKNSGTGIMAKKGSPLVAWWNPVFARWTKSGGFARFCKRASKKYNFEFECLSSPTRDFSDYLPHEDNPAWSNLFSPKL